MDQSITDEQKTALDALHRRKIDLADRVMIVSHLSINPYLCTNNNP
jgi:hypothetical protein